HTKEEPQMVSHRRKGERGIGLLAVALWIGALAVIAAVAVDVARLSHTASEGQSIADATAPPGPQAPPENPGAAGPRQTAAFQVAHQNMFNGQLFPLSNDATANLLVEPGTFDPAASPPFSPSAGGGNSVRATPTVRNIPFVAAALVGPFLNQASTTGSD